MIRGAVILLGCLCGWCAAAQASPVDLFGFGARGGAMGGAVAASPEGAEAVYYNPAGLALELHPSFLIGYQRATASLWRDGQRLDARPAPALVLGFGVPLPLRGWLERRLSLGLGFVLPQTSIILADIPAPGEPSFILVENRAQVATVQGALAVRLWDELCLGVGFLALAELQGAIDVAPNDTGQLGSRVRDEVIADYSPTAGLLWRPTPALSAGVTLRGESSAGFSLPITADLGDGFTLPIPALDITGTAQYDPRQVALELAWRPWEGALLGAGATWKQWGRFQNPIVYTAVPDDYPPQPPPRFSDTWAPRIGAEHTLQWPSWALTPRAGLAFEPSPVPEQRGDQNYLDSDRWISSLGVGARVDRARVDLMAQWHHMPARTHRKLEDGSTLRHSGDLWVWGLNLQLEL